MRNYFCEAADVISGQQFYLILKPDLSSKDYARQLPGLEVALCHGNGGRLSSQVTALLGTANTL